MYARTRGARYLLEPQHGFSMIELIVVLVIIAIVVGFGAQVLLSPRKTASKRSAAVAARAYGEAIAKFQRDHGGRPPALGTADWPTDAILNGPVRKSPVGMSSDDSARSYMDGGRPENVGPGAALDLCQTPAACEGAQSGWRASYQLIGTGLQQSWRITLVPPVNSNHQQCEIFGAPIAARASVRDCP